MSFSQKISRVAVLTAALMSPVYHEQASGQHMGISAQQGDMLKNLKKLAADVAAGVPLDAGRAKRIIEVAVSDYNKITKKSHVVGPNYTYARIATPEELGANVAIIVDPVNESLAIVSGVKQNANGTLDTAVASHAGHYIKLDKKQTARAGTAELQESVFAVALHAVKEANALVLRNGAAPVSLSGGQKNR